MNKYAPEFKFVDPWPSSPRGTNLFMPRYAHPIGKESKEDLPNPQLITGGKLAFGKQALQAK